MGHYDTEALDAAKRKIEREQAFKLREDMLKITRDVRDTLQNPICNKNRLRELNIHMLKEIELWAFENNLYTLDDV